MNRNARRIAPEAIRATSTEVGARGNTIDVAGKNNSLAVSTLDDSLFERVTFQPPADKNTVGSVSLFHAIERALEYEPNSVVQLTTPTTSRASLDTAYSLVWTGTTLLGRRILLIDASQPGHRVDLATTGTAVDSAQSKAGKSARKVRAVATGGSDTSVAIWRSVGGPPDDLKRLSDVRVGGACLEETIVRDAHGNMFVTTFDPDAVGKNGTLSGRDFDAQLDKLRPHFDMIVIVPPAVLDEPLATILGGVTDGSVMVLEAGRSRRGTVKRAIEALDSGAIPVLGVVMSQRPSHLPSWIRRFLGE